MRLGLEIIPMVEEYSPRHCCPCTYTFDIRWCQADGQDKAIEKSGQMSCPI